MFGTFFHCSLDTSSRLVTLANLYNKFPVQKFLFNFLDKNNLQVTIKHQVFI